MRKKYWMIFMAAAMLSLTACGSDEKAKEDTAVEATGEEDEMTLPEYAPVTYGDLTSTIVSLGEYKGLEGTKQAAEVTDADVQKEIRDLKKDYAELVDVDRAAEEGDVVLIDYTGYVDGETSDSLQGTEFSLELGSGEFVPGFEDQLIGVSAGQNVEVNLTFPEEYYEEMAGKDARFEVYVHKVRTYEVEDWGDDFVKENLGYEGISDMEETIRKELEDAAESDAESELQYDLIQTLLDNCEYDIREADVEAYIDEMLLEYRTYAAMNGQELNEYLKSALGITEEQLREAFRETARFRVKMTLTFHEIAALEGIEATDEECTAQMEQMAAEYGYNSAEEVEALYSREMVREELIQEKVIDFIRENAAVK